jgi:tetratricopeptide (TPR) repeat protein
MAPAIIYFTTKNVIVMSGKYKIVTVTIVTGMLALLIVYKNTSGKKTSGKPLLERTGPISTTTEWINTKAAIYGLQDQIRKKPDDLSAKLLLALAYMQEARITGEHPYYYPAALELIEEVIDEQSDPSLRFEALVAKASVLLSLHHFEEALEIGNQALLLNKNNASVYGILCDAHVELGNYSKAVEMADAMIAIRPDIRSYARVSYLREIHGDLPGAVKAMHLAVSAGYPGLEQTAWTRVTLGLLYEKQGDLENASRQYNLAVDEYPNYAFGIGGLARIEAKKKNYAGSIRLFSKAGEIIPEFSFQEGLVNLYKKTGKISEAEKASEKLRAMLSEDEEAGHCVDLELANIYLDIIEDTDKALKYGEKAYEQRPHNIDVCKTLAYIYYRKKDIKAAEKYLKTATRMHSQDASLLCLSGLISLKKGKKEAGLQLIKKALELDPFLDNELAVEAKKILTVMLNDESRS